MIISGSFLVCTFFAEAQQSVLHEIGFGVGLVSFKGDWGYRRETRINFQNSGFGINISIYKYSSFTRNQKIRSSVWIFFVNFGISYYLEQHNSLHKKCHLKLSGIFYVI